MRLISLLLLFATLSALSFAMARQGNNIPPAAPASGYHPQQATRDEVVARYRLKRSLAKAGIAKRAQISGQPTGCEVRVTDARQYGRMQCQKGFQRCRAAEIDLVNYGTTTIPAGASGCSAFLTRCNALMNSLAVDNTVGNPACGNCANTVRAVGDACLQANGQTNSQFCTPQDSLEQSVCLYGADIAGHYCQSQTYSSAVSIGCNQVPEFNQVCRPIFTGGGGASFGPVALLCNTDTNQQSRPGCLNLGLAVDECYTQAYDTCAAENPPRASLTLSQQCTRGRNDFISKNSCVTAACQRFFPGTDRCAPNKGVLTAITQIRTNLLNADGCDFSA